MDDLYTAIAKVTATIVGVLLLSLTLVAYLSGGLQAVAAMLTTFLIIALPLALLVGLILFVMKRV